MQCGFDGLARAPFGVQPFLGRGELVCRNLALALQALDVLGPLGQLARQRNDLVLEPVGHLRNAPQLRAMQTARPELMGDVPFGPSHRHFSRLSDLFVLVEIAGLQPQAPQLAAGKPPAQAALASAIVNVHRPNWRSIG